MANNSKIKKWFSSKEQIKKLAGRIWLKDKVQGMTVKLFVQTSGGKKKKVIPNIIIQSHKSSFTEIKESLKQHVL